MSDITSQPATELAERLAGGVVSAREVADAFLDRVEQRDDEVQAFAYLDPDDVQAQADALDARRKAGAPIGPLHGIPVGIKDIIDTGGVPTENGSVIDAGRVPRHDAAVVERLRAAGAIVFGKTVTTEFAFKQPSITRNPHDLDHTPGGSSSGSAAAVADAMAPLAIGTQTAGSVVRPASFCGTVGYKPTFGLVPRRGVLATALSLDTVGVFANTVTDAALTVDAIAGHDPGDPATRPAPRPRLAETARAEPPVKPMLAFVKTAAWDLAGPEVSGGFGEIVEALGEQVDEVPLPSAFDQVLDWHRIIYTAEFSKFIGGYTSRAADAVSEEARGWIDEGRRVLAHDYLAALDWRDVLYAGLEEIFDRYDAIITPAATGPAPKGLESTGDPSFNAPWTLLHVPAVSLPLLQSEEGLPVGVQVVGPRGDDARLLRTARWLQATLMDGE